MDPSPIYVSSPGVLVDTTPPGYQRLVYVPPVSTIGQQFVVRDRDGFAGSRPIIVSTTQNAIFRDGTSTHLIDKPYGYYAFAAFKPATFMPLAQPTAADPAFTPSFQYISSSVQPRDLNVEFETRVFGTLVNGAPLFTTVADASFNVANFSTGTLSTATVSTGNFYGRTATPLSTIADYISAASAVFSTTTSYNVTVGASASLQSSLTIAGGFTIGGNFSLRGTAVVSDLSGGLFFSSLAGAYVGQDMSGGTWLKAGYISSAGNTWVAGLTQVSSATVAEALSTQTALITNGVFQTLAVGRGGAAGLFTLDVSGSGQATVGTTVAGLSTALISAATTTLSSLNLVNMTTAAADRLNVVGTTLYLNETPFGSGGLTCNYVGNTFTASNYLYTNSTIVSSIAVGSNVYNPDFNVSVYGSAHTSTFRSSMYVAVGMNPKGVSNAERTSSIIYSFNGSNWVSARTGGFAVGHDVAYNGKMWVAVGTMWDGSTTGNSDTLNRSTIQYSLDGSNWTSCRTGGFQGSYSNAGNTAAPGAGGGIGIAWNGRMWIATGEYSLGTNGTTSNSVSTIQYSYDGSNFSAVLTASNYPAINTASYGRITLKPTWNGRMWLAGIVTPAASSNSNTLFSYDGLNWSTITVPLVNFAQNFVWNGRMWIGAARRATGVASGVASTMIYSYTGFDWSYVIGTTMGSGTAWNVVNGALWNGFNWFAISPFSNATTGNINRSYDGINWQSMPAATTRFASDTSSEGFFSVWLAGYIGSASGGQKLMWDGRRYYAVGGSSAANSIESSTDGITWTNVTAGVSNPIICGIAVNSNVNEEITMSGLDIIPNGIQQTYLSTNQIYGVSTMITFNQTLFVDSQQQVAVNSIVSSLSTLYRFYVNGSILTNGAFKLGGATTWTAVSDERVKTDISCADISECYYKIRDTHVHLYQFKPSYSAKYGLKQGPQYGLYAQELESVFPECVMETDVLGETVKMIDPSQLHLAHYGASAFLYSTLKQNKSTLFGSDSNIGAYRTSNAFTTLANYINSNTGQLANSATYFPNLSNAFTSNYY